MPELHVEKTGEMLNEEQYWSLIDNSLKLTQDQDQQGQFLISEIKKLSPHEMIGFTLRTHHLLNEMYTSEMWCAGYIMNSFCSDDGFEYFRCWIISRGKEVYYNAKADPDYLVNEVVEGCEIYEFELFGDAANEVFEETTGKELLDHIDYKHPRIAETFFEPIAFNWQPGNPESMKKICPKLYDKLGYRRANKII
jgi:hypothetical protein